MQVSITLCARMPFWQLLEWIFFTHDKINSILWSWRFSYTPKGCPKSIAHTAFADCEKQSSKQVAENG
jgi:hypothetical protein